MKAKKLSFSFTRLWNSEYPVVVENILKIVEKNNPEELHLKKAYDKLNAFVPDLEKIKAQAKNTGATDVITQKDDLRDRHTRAIFTVVDTYRKSGFDNYAESAKTIATFFKDNEYTRGLVNENYTSQTNKTKQLIADVEDNTKIKKAFDVLGLFQPLMKLKTLNNELAELFRNRTAEQAQMPEIDIKQIRKKVDEVIDQLFITIEASRLEYDDKDYNPLIKEIKTLLDYHRAQLKTRKTKSATKKSKEKSEETPTPEVKPAENVRLSEVSE